MLLRKIRRIFEVAVYKGIKILVLGAWGCGVYANPPSHIAELFKQVTQNKNFVKCQNWLFNSYQVSEG